MNIQELARQLKQNYEWSHDMEWGLYKVSYVMSDGTKMWTDDPQEVYVEYRQLIELDNKRNEITKQLIFQMMTEN